MAARYLIELSHNHMAQLNGPFGLELAKDRRGGFLQSVSEVGMKGFVFFSRALVKMD
jgi:DNA-binding LacI/PurR family transcriptional regulator